MRALVVYESLFGNTRQAAESVADGIRAAAPDARVDCVGVDTGMERPPEVEDVDLLVVGGPTHFWGMTSALSRTMELQYERRLRRRRPGGDRLDPRCARPTGLLRDWLAAVPSGNGVLAAAFDTRMIKGLTGGAAPFTSGYLRRRGYRLATGPMAFVVDGITGPPRPGERERAVAWGRDLANAVPSSCIAGQPDIRRKR